MCYFNQVNRIYDKKSNTSNQTFYLYKTSNIHMLSIMLLLISLVLANQSHAKTQIDWANVAQGVAEALAAPTTQSIPSATKPIPGPIYTNFGIDQANPLIGAFNPKQPSENRFNPDTTIEKSFGPQTLPGRKKRFGIAVGDMCRNGNGGCDQICTPTNGGASCSCYPGFELLTDLRSCREMNGCSGPQECSHRCENLGLGKYQCLCPQGYALSEDLHNCILIPDCQPNHGRGPCHQLCQVYQGSLFCGCYAGYKLDQDNGIRCVDIDECLVGLPNGWPACATDGSQRCVNKDGSYECSCSEGYTPTEAIDDTRNYFHRDMRSQTRLAFPNQMNFSTPTRRLALQNTRSTIPRENGKVLSKDFGQKFAKDNRQTNRNLAVNSTSMLQAAITGTQSVGGILSGITTFYQSAQQLHNLQRSLNGPLSQNTAERQNIDEQTTNIHNKPHFEDQKTNMDKISNQKLTKTLNPTISIPRRQIFPSEFQSPANFEWLICNKLSACQRSPVQHLCPKHKICIDKADSDSDSYECACPQYQLEDSLGKCHETVQCSIHNPDGPRCHHKCHNNGDHYICECHHGYEMISSGLCIDIDECTKNIHNCSHGCQNLPGSFICTCPPGMVLGSDGATCEISQCSSKFANLCSHGCKNMNGTFICTCPVGWILDTDHLNCIRGSPQETNKTNITSNQITSVQKLECPTGFQINQQGICIDIDECHIGYPRRGMNPCPTPSRPCCRNTNGSFVCEKIARKFNTKYKHRLCQNPAILFGS